MNCLFKVISVIDNTTTHDVFLVRDRDVAASVGIHIIEFLVFIDDDEPNCNSGRWTWIPAKDYRPIRPYCERRIKIL